MTTVANSKKGKPRYKIDLVGQQALCEHNYARLLLLLPDWETIDECRYAISYGEHEAKLCLNIRQRCPYTTVLDVCHEADWGQWLAPPLMQVRIYHDLRMAEVVGALKQNSVAARYEYPNDRMCSPDEKAQWNLFLAEWLRHCIAGGRSLALWPPRQCD